MNTPKPGPKVTIIIPCYNMGHYLDGTVNSVLAQTFQDFEIIIINPGSTDEHTNAMLANYKRPNTRVITTPHISLSESRNVGIKESKSPYICCLDADDIYEPDCFEKCCGILDRHKDVGFVTFWYRIFGEEEGEFKPSGVELTDLLVKNNACVASMFRKEAWQKVGGYDERVKGYEDWDFWISILDAGYKASLIKEFLFRYRIRPGSMRKEADLFEKKSVILQEMFNKHKVAFQENEAVVLMGKERIIAEAINFQNKLLEARKWYQARDRKHEHYIRELENSRTSIRRTHESAMEQQRREIDAQRALLANRARELSVRAAEIRSLNDRLIQQQHIINLRERELMAICSSKSWKLGCAFRDAKGSLKGALLLPFRLLDLGIPDCVKRGVKQLLLIRQGEVIKKSFYKFPYRLLDRLVPARLKQVIPYQIRNLARGIFHTTDKRIHVQKRWNGPLVSVVIPCYNYGQYLEEALQSALDQTFKNYEIIVIDDGSTDRFTIEKLNAIEQCGHAGVHVIRQRNAGVSTARNNGIRLARGKYICCLDADDCLHSTYLEKCLLLLESGNLDLCYTHVRIFGDETGVWETQPMDVHTLMRANCVSTAAVFKKSIWRKAGGFNTNMHHGWEDWDFWLSVAEARGTAAVIPEALFFYRRHGTTRDVNAAVTHADQLLALIKQNHSGLYEGRKKLPAGVRYQVIDPLVNIHNGGGGAAFPGMRDGILFLLPWMVVGGADNVLLRLMRTLETDGDMQVHILTTVVPPSSMGDSMADFLEVTPYIYRLPYLLDERLWLPHVEYYIRQRNIKTIFLCGASFFYPHLPAIKEKYPSVRVLDQLFNNSTMGHVQNNRRHAQWIDHTLVVSDKIKKSILATYREDPERISTIYHGTDLGFFDPSGVSAPAARERFGFPEDARIILWVGRCSVEKNPLLFLEIAKEFSDEKEYLFVLAGDGPLLDEIKARACKMRLDKLVFPGMVTKEDVRFLYRCASVLVVTSEVEGIPLTIYESLSMGVPVVTTDVGGISDVVRDGENGFLCTERDITCIAQKVREALSYPWRNIRDSLGTRHDLRNVFSQYLDMIRGVK